MSVAVVVPWRGDGGARCAAWTYVSRWWQVEHPGWDLATGDSSGVWCKAAAVRAGIDAVPGADVLVVADADVVCDPVVTARLVAQVTAHGGWGVPARRVARLTEDATERVLSGGVHPPLPRREEVAERYGHRSAGGVVVIRRVDYDTCPLDPRFHGWDLEDFAWSRALTTMHGLPMRPGVGVPAGDMVHLWHPPVPRQDRAIGTPEGHDLYRRYERASGDAPRMRRLLAEIGDHQ